MKEKWKPFRNPLCVALDVDSRDEAMSLVSETQDIVGGYKLGPRLIHRYGQSLVQEIARKAPVFVDCKFFDIPSTMISAVRAVYEAGASVVTVHALAGREALGELAKLENELRQQREFRVLAVTILTSWGPGSFPPNFKTQTVEQHVVDLAELVKLSGLNGIVCSPNELDLLANMGLFLLTPGIRLPEDDKGDQKRVLGPFEAIKKGANALVIGRPIVAAKNPRKAANEFLSEIYR